MKVGVCIPNYGQGASKKSIDLFSKIAEENYDSVWTVDHLLVPLEYSSPWGRILESLSVLSYLAGKTEHVKLGTGVIVFPMRETVLFAKQASTLQILSNNRLLLGLGAGWNEREFENLGADFESRGQFFDEGIQLFKWFMRGNAEFSGEFYTIKDGVFDPCPSKEMPIYIGGQSGQSLRRAARLADGWFPEGISPNQLALGRKKLDHLTSRKITLLARLTVLFSDDGSSKDVQFRKHSTKKHVQLSGTSSEIAERIGKYKGAGLEHLVCYFGDREERILELKAIKFAKEVIPSI